MRWLNRPSDEDDRSPGSDVSAADPSSAAPAVDLEAERRVLLDLLIYAWDRAKSPGVWERLAAGLETVGVQVLRPVGEPFDPSAQEVGGVEITDEVSLVDTVAETERAGFADRGRLIREPIVVVYRSR